MTCSPKPLDIDYRPATEDDLRYVHGLEMLIEDDHAASFDTLAARFKMHPHGFIVAHHNNTMVGYLQSCILDRSKLDTFDETKDLFAYHTESGNEAHVTSLGIRVEYDQKTITTNLLKKLETFAVMGHLDSISLVAKESLIDLYQKSGVEIVCTMDNFLPNSNKGDFLMQKNLNDKPVFNPAY